MNINSADLAVTANFPEEVAVIKLAIMAVGGQGGGVLTKWIEQCARSNGYAVQATSVAGVAQRTGATIYYIEMAPATIDSPVFALLPAAGDVDILIAAEMMEAGRAIMRGFVTPDRTTLIASEHRILALSEKSVSGDGISKNEEILESAKKHAKRQIIFDMEKIAVDAGSVISASLFGALAGSKALPFSRESFEASIKASGRGVEASLDVFSAAYDKVENPEKISSLIFPRKTGSAFKAVGNPSLVAAWNVLEEETEKFPETVRKIALIGLRKVVEYQDTKYGDEYLSRLTQVMQTDDPKNEFRLTCETAKHLANAMSYDDVIRVADLKTRKARNIRINKEMGINGEDYLKITEFLHPRAEEIVGMLPNKLGFFIEQRSGLMALIERVFSKKRLVRTDSLLGFIQLYFLGGLRTFRRRSYRYKIEQNHIDNWLSSALSLLPNDYNLALEVIRARRLIKGYGDTHSRGLTKFDRVIDGISLLSAHKDSAYWAQKLQTAALDHEDDIELKKTLQNIRSLS